MTTTTFRVENLKVGDEVGITGTSDFDDAIGAVAKVNGHGHVMVEIQLGNDAQGQSRPPRQITFDKHGDERGAAKFCGKRLCDANAIRDRRERRRIEKESQASINALVAEIEAHRHCGSYYINEATKAKIIELANAIKTRE